MCVCVCVCKSAKILLSFSLFARLFFFFRFSLSPLLFFASYLLHSSILLSSMYGIAKSFYSFRFLALPIIPGVTASLRLLLTLPRAPLSASLDAVSVIVVLVVVVGAMANSSP